MDTPSREALVAEAEKVNAQRMQLVSWVESEIGSWDRSMKRLESQVDRFSRIQRPSERDANFLTRCRLDLLDATRMLAQWSALLSLLHADAAKVQELEQGREWQLLAETALHNIVAAVCANGMSDVVQKVEALRADRDRLTAEVERLKGHKCHSCSLGCEKVCKADLAGCPSECLSLPYRRHLNMTHRAEKAEADVTRLTARWEALGAWSHNTYTDDELTPSGSEKLRKKMAELEAQR